MASLRLAPIASRAARLAAASVLVSSFGCSHHRQSLKPVYVGPRWPATRPREAP